MLGEIKFVGDIIDFLRYFEVSDVLGSELLAGSGLGISDVFDG